MSVSVLAAPCAPAQTLTAAGELGFGRFAAGTGGTVTVTPGAVRSKTGGVVLMASTASAALFSMKAAANKQLIITLPPNGSAALVSGNASMALTDFTSNRLANGVLGPGTGGVAIGATLQVAPNQPAASYTGSFQIIVEYQ